MKTRPSATDVVNQLIRDYPNLFQDNKETYTILGTALINYGKETTEFILEQTFHKSDAEILKEEMLSLNPVNER